MALDTEDIKLITNLQSQMERRLVAAINGTATGTRATVESEVNRIDEMDKIRNGKIDCNQRDIDILQNETRGSRWAQRNPKVAIIGFIILVASIALGAYNMNVKRTIEKIIPIEFYAK